MLCYPSAMHSYLDTLQPALLSTILTSLCRPLCLALLLRQPLPVLHGKKFAVPTHG